MKILYSEASQRRYSIYFFLNKWVPKAPTNLKFALFRLVSGHMFLACTHSLASFQYGPSADLLFDHSDPRLPAPFPSLCSAFALLAWPLCRKKICSGLVWKPLHCTPPTPFGAVSKAGLPPTTWGHLLSVYEQMLGVLSVRRSPSVIEAPAC